MVKKEDILDDNSSVNSEDTTESSDSYSYLLRDVENPNNHVNEEWEAIERTLYQESGKHVTDPVLLKECKLWRETFPHLRIRGTAVNVEQEENVGDQSTKSLQSIDKNHLPLASINEKREKIKKTVVSQIVQRLINKLTLNNENSLVSKKLINDKGNTKQGVKTKSSGTESELESYFERGKSKENKGELTQKAIEKFVESAKCDSYQKNGFSSLDDFESNFSLDYNKIGNKAGLWSGYSAKKSNLGGKEFSSNVAKNEEISRLRNIKFKLNEKNSSGQRRRETTLESSQSRIFKPFEMTKKIDKKYEIMLEKILENQGFMESESKKILKQETMSCRESMENVTGISKREYITNGKNYQLPKLNNFTSNWMNRVDQYSYDPDSNSFTSNQSNSNRYLRNIGKHSNFQYSQSANSAYQFNEKFLEEIGTEICDFKANSIPNDFEEQINLRPEIRSKYNQSNTAKTQKSSSCGDLPKKKNPRYSSRMLKSSLEKGKSEISTRNGNKKTGTQNFQLPPIETSIICTKITKRPKAVSRSLPKKYI